MNNSNNTVGMLIFLALGIAVFVLMALRPAVERSTMNFGIPLNAEMATSKTMEGTTEEAPVEDKVEEKQDETVVPEAEKSTEESSATDATETETSTENTDSTEQSTTTN